MTPPFVAATAACERRTQPRQKRASQSQRMGQTGPMGAKPSQRGPTGANRSQPRPCRCGEMTQRACARLAIVQIVAIEDPLPAFGVDDPGSGFASAPSFGGAASNPGRTARSSRAASPPDCLSANGPRPTRSPGHRNRRSCRRSARNRICCAAASARTPKRQRRPPAAFIFALDRQSECPATAQAASDHLGRAAKLLGRDLDAAALRQEGGRPHPVDAPAALGCLHWLAPAACTAGLDKVVFSGSVSAGLTGPPRLAWRRAAASSRWRH